MPCRQGTPVTKAAARFSHCGTIAAAADAAKDRGCTPIRVAPLRYFPPLREPRAVAGGHGAGHRTLAAALCTIRRAVNDVEGVRFVLIRARLDEGRSRQDI